MPLPKPSNSQNSRHHNPRTFHTTSSHSLQNRVSDSDSFLILYSLDGHQSFESHLYIAISHKLDSEKFILPIPYFLRLSTFCHIMGFAMDPRMQRIIENASANVQDDDPFPVPPFTRAPPLPPSQPTFSRHFNNGSSLQDMFTFGSSQQSLPIQPHFMLDDFGK